MNELSIAAFATSILALFGIALPAYTPAISKHPPESERPQIITSLDESFTIKSALVFNIANGERAIDVDSTNVLPIASLTKIMTGLLALETFGPDEQILLSKNAGLTDGDVGHLRQGEWFFVQDLLRAMMMSSSNDAATALAEEMGERMGGEIFEDRISLFVEEMNRKARALGMRDTRFENPTGLDDLSGGPSNYSSANDLAILIRATKQTPLLWELSRDREREVYSDRGREYFLFNLNEIIGSIPNFIGSKTGSTLLAGDSLVFLFEYPLGTQRAAIILNAASGRRFEEAKRILEMTLNMIQ